MRRHALFIGMMVSFLITPSLPAQDPGAAARQEIEENLKTLSARMDDLAAANEAMQKSITKLREDMAKVAEEAARAGDRSKDAATAESLKHLKSAIEEVDHKRLADQKLVLAELESLRKILEKPLPKSFTPAPPPRNGGGNPGPIGNRPEVRPEARPETPPANMSIYKIQDGDTLSLIVAELRKKGIKITQKQIMDANPGVAWTKLKINQSINIPVPPQ